MNRVGARSGLLIIGSLVLAACAAAFVFNFEKLSGKAGKPKSPFTTEYSGDLIPVSYGKRCGFANLKGQLVINPQYEAATFFNNQSNLAAVRLGGRWGLIDRRGKFIVSPQFDGIEITGNPPIHVVRLQDRRGIVDESGTYTVTPQFTSIEPYDDEGWAVAAVGPKEGFIDRSGQYVIPPKFEGLGVFFDGLARAYSGSGWGYIDRSGKWAIEPTLEGSTPFDESGLAVALVLDAEKVKQRSSLPADVRVDPADLTSRGYIDRKGNFVIPPTFDGAEQFGLFALAPARKGALWGFIDRRGNFKIPQEFAVAHAFARAKGHDLAIVGVERPAGSGGPKYLYGAIDETGAYRIKPQFDYMSDFDENGVSIVTVSDLMGMVDVTGKYIVNPIYEDLIWRDGAGYFFQKPVDPGSTHGDYDLGFLKSNGKILGQVRGGRCIRAYLPR